MLISTPLLGGIPLFATPNSSICKLNPSPFLVIHNWEFDPATEILDICLTMANLEFDQVGEDLIFCAFS